MMKIRIVKNRITGILSVKRMLRFLALYFSPFLFSQMYVSEGATLYIGKDAQVVTKTNTEADKKDVAENTIYSKGGRILIADASQKYRIVLVPRRVLADNSDDSSKSLTSSVTKSKERKTISRTNSKSTKEQFVIPYPNMQLFLIKDAQRGIAMVITEPGSLRTGLPGVAVTSCLLSPIAASAIRVFPPYSVVGKSRFFLQIGSVRPPPYSA